ncbi:hypothetical protein E5676_scaffold1185G00440 [Cucumis melo var. makuwa]|uniref:Uncharacterized protein n=1 Tax=Cucumis melo var. makuwa TaxID=1194695 RepID=A0A5A7VSK1_CUCMM|nr:hypothetical protein E6C27_scaffold238G00570 [Cucumis melo var. makuwa]TYK26081.1 hypothetical protein E5676_scaffold1185G00440 [Cucumis melo var. makuwa]
MVLVKCKVVESQQCYDGGKGLLFLTPKVSNRVDDVFVNVLALDINDQHVDDEMRTSIIENPKYAQGPEESKGVKKDREKVEGTFVDNVNILHMKKSFTAADHTIATFLKHSLGLYEEIKRGTHSVDVESQAGERTGQHEVYSPNSLASRWHLHVKAQPIWDTVNVFGRGLREDWGRSEKDWGRSGIVKKRERKDYGNVE